MKVPDYPTEVYPGIWVGPHQETARAALVVLTAFQHQSVHVPPGCRIHFCPLTDDAFGIVSGDVERCHAAAKEIVNMFHIQPLARVLVTCSAGQNRSSWVAGRAMINLGVSPADAVRKLEASRAFHNWFFKQDLLKGSD